MYYRSTPSSVPCSSSRSKSSSQNSSRSFSRPGSCFSPFHHVQPPLSTFSGNSHFTSTGLATFAHSPYSTLNVMALSKSMHRTIRRNPLPVQPQLPLAEQHQHRVSRPSIHPRENDRAITRWKRVSCISKRHIRIGSQISTGPYS